MIRKFLKRCKHNFVVVAHIGGDTQNTAMKCTKCNKKKVVADNRSNFCFSYDEVVRRGISMTEGTE